MTEANDKYPLSRREVRKLFQKCFPEDYWQSAYAKWVADERRKWWKRHPKLASLVNGVCYYYHSLVGVEWESESDCDGTIHTKYLMLGPVKAYMGNRFSPWDHYYGGWDNTVKVLSRQMLKKYRWSLNRVEPYRRWYWSDYGRDYLPSMRGA